MNNYPAIGESWGRVKCINHDVGEHIVKINGQHEFYSGVVFTIRCECGTEFELNKLQWRGKKFHKDCGCGIAEGDRYKIMKTISIPIPLWAKVEQYANENCNANKSRAARELFEVGLDVWEGRAIHAKS